MFEVVWRRTVGPFGDICRRAVRTSRAGARPLLAVALLALATGQSSARCPDLALVLAIDASGSIGNAEFLMQMQGYAAAFRSAAVQKAIRSAGEVQVAVVLWGDAEMSSQVLPFRDVSSEQAAVELADLIGGVERRVTGNTGIGRGLWTALDLIEVQMACALRHVVNVSGDGRETHSPRSRNSLNLKIARKRAEALGVTVNALAIQSRDSNLADYYSRNLLVGPDAFVMGVGSLATFAEAIEAKLAREITSLMLASDEGRDGGSLE